MLPMQASSEAVLDLRRRVRDLVALTGLPARWCGPRILTIGERLSDALFDAPQPHLR